MNLEPVRLVVGFNLKIKNLKNLMKSNEGEE